MRSYFRLFCLLALSAIAACNPAGLTVQGTGVSSGRPDFSLQAPEGFQYIAAGVLTASVPSEVAIRPPARVSFALFSGSALSSAPLLHILTAELPTPAWRFALESSKEPEDLDFSKETRDGRFLTLRTRAIRAQGDWFAELAGRNGMQPAELMLARRVSFTPTDRTRVVLEYREPLPACMVEFTETLGTRLRVAPPLPRECRSALEAFNRRADAALVLQKNTNAPAAPLPGFITPDFLPDMAMLCGTAEPVERDDPSYRP